ncbi:MULTISPECIES: glycine betaine ABC transporter substrate-binding protein [unclassified Methanoculleus]|jgi:glycine betaine/proline transport system substrate-binding protein|uniref:Glycine betaine ABC transporter substrate-binding protein n=1 Tax=Methanoculleus palmolei TaxID=72612 RepID=A0ABD8A890_9EURY|nr:glycine betaine ABC transporter substrate-binding protein [Methanoculleus sp. UBA377]WOX55737.1 glycine betaine ABC transporter substrate-binding protein [Methanoculleus palmolei]
MIRQNGNPLIPVGIVIALCLFSAGCIGTQGTEPAKTISIGYVTWDCAIASTNVMKQVFEEAGYEVTLVAVDAGPLFQALARGDVDFTTTGWLPHTHEHYWEQYGDQIDYVNKNIPGAARIGLVVPTYVTIDSIEEMNGVADRFGGRIVGIEPGAGIMTRTEQAIEEYDLDYDLVASSSAGMAAELASAINHEDWVVVTGWSPHWKFGRYDLKFLEDPRGVYGGAEDIVTLARADLATDDPEAYGILTRFEWTGEDISSVMTDIENGMPEEEAAKAWIAANPEKVRAWLGEA